MNLLLALDGHYENDQMTQTLKEVKIKKINGWLLYLHVGLGTIFWPFNCCFLKHGQM